MRNVTMCRAGAKTIYLFFILFIGNNYLVQFQSNRTFQECVGRKAYMTSIVDAHEVEHATREISMNMSDMYSSLENLGIWAWTSVMTFGWCNKFLSSDDTRNGERIALFVKRIIGHRRITDSLFVVCSQEIFKFGSVWAVGALAWIGGKRTRSVGTENSFRRFRFHSRFWLYVCVCAGALCSEVKSPSYV